MLYQVRKMVIDFKYGGPIEPDLFYDREKVVGFLLSKISQITRGVRHNYALVGPRRTGKTSILYILRKRLPKNNLIPVLIDCEGRELAKQAELTTELFLEIWGNAVLDAYFQRARLVDKIRIKLGDFVLGTKDKIVSALSEVLGQVRALEIKTASEYLSFRVELEKATERPSPKELAKLFEDTMNLSEKLGKEKSVYFVMMLDEFQYVDKFKRPLNFLPAFRRHLQRQRKTAYLLTGSNIGMMEKILLGGPLGGHVPIEWIDVFEADVARNFLKERFVTLRRKISEETLERIVAFANQHPAYLNWFGEQCCKEVKPGGTIPQKLVNDLEKKVFDRDGLMHVFEEDLRRLSPRKSKIYQTFVEMAGHDLGSPTEISKHVSRSTPVEIITYLKRLEQRGFVRRAGEGKYLVVDKMLGKYVKEKIHATM